MKKMISFFVAVACAISIAAPISAGETQLTLVVPEPTYTLSIPENQTIVYGTEKTRIGNITITESAGFTPTQALQVSVTSDGKFYQTGGENIILFYPRGEGHAVSGAPGAWSWSLLPDGTGNPAPPVLFKTQEDGSLTATGTADLNDSDIINLENVAIEIKPEAFANAAPGTYTAVITFTAEIINVDAEK